MGSGVEGLREVLDRSKICLYLSNRFSPSSKTTLQHGASSMCRWCSLFAALEYKLLSSYMPSLSGRLLQALRKTRLKKSVRAYAVSTDDFLVRGDLFGDLDHAFIDIFLRFRTLAFAGDN